MLIHSKAEGLAEGQGGRERRGKEGGDGRLGDLVLGVGFTGNKKKKKTGFFVPSTPFSQPGREQDDCTEGSLFTFSIPFVYVCVCV